MASSLFISYSHADMVDTDWLDRLKMYLAPMRRAQSIEIWDDNQIQPGAKWKKEIETALSNADTAILLVGPGFIASDFVMDREVPALFKSAHVKGLKIFPLIIAYCGYQATELNEYQAFNDPDVPLESLTKPEQNKMLNNLCVEVGKVMQSKENSITTASEAQILTTVEYVKEIQRNLSDTRTAITAQSKRRNNLVEAIEKRLKIHNNMEYEKFFFTYFPQLNDSEKFEFDMIRAITEGPLHDGNRRIVEILRERPELLEEIPELMELRQHLVFWLNKFDKVFTQNKAMCILYTGVEDGVPFPSGIDDVIDKWLNRT